jgi:5'-methylthioadenosine phosphorylase
VVPKLANRKHVCDHGCHHALDTAIITAPAARDPAVVAELEPIVGRILK